MGISKFNAPSFPTFLQIRPLGYKWCGKSLWPCIFRPWSKFGTAVYRHHFNLKVVWLVWWSAEKKKKEESKGWCRNGYRDRGRTLIPLIRVRLWKAFCRITLWGQQRSFESCQCVQAWTSVARCGKNRHPWKLHPRCSMMRLDASCV